eukprot:GILJ01015770.1.p1 GENE.GILJ01015770.1~~GILJ01015770.1.p1  ORF type:complete len:430 (+),score=68.15 GILJ01015770.1:140-1429(+)
MSKFAAYSRKLRLSFDRANIARQKYGTYNLTTNQQELHEKINFLVARDKLLKKFKSDVQAFREAINRLSRCFIYIGDDVRQLYEVPTHDIPLFDIQENYTASKINLLSDNMSLVMQRLENWEENFKLLVSHVHALQDAEEAHSYYLKKVQKLKTSSSRSSRTIERMNRNDKKMDDATQKLTECVREVELAVESLTALAVGTINPAVLQFVHTEALYFQQVSQVLTSSAHIPSDSYSKPPAGPLMLTAALLSATAPALRPTEDSRLSLTSLQPIPMSAVYSSSNGPTALATNGVPFVADHEYVSADHAESPYKQQFQEGSPIPPPIYSSYPQRPQGTLPTHAEYNTHTNSMSDAESAKTDCPPAYQSMTSSGHLHTASAPDLRPLRTTRTLNVMSVDAGSSSEIKYESQHSIRTTDLRLPGVGGPTSVMA